MRIKTCFSVDSSWLDQISRVHFWGGVTLPNGHSGDHRGSGATGLARRLAPALPPGSQLIERTSGPRHHVFKVLRGVAKEHPPLCLFILPDQAPWLGGGGATSPFRHGPAPYLVLNVAMHGSEPHRRDVMAGPTAPSFLASLTINPRVPQSSPV